ncbi:MAG: geranylgeranyl reductase [Promethearchaeota archaeon]
MGAGPAGAVAAAELAGREADVLLLEKAQMPPGGRYKACGGAMAWELVEAARFPPELVDREVDELVLHHVDGEVFGKRGRGAVVWRSKFDEFLVKRAVKAGAEFVDGTPLVTVHQRSPAGGERDADWNYELVTPAGVVRAKFLVAADGAASPTLRALGFPPFRRDQLVVTITEEVRVGAARVEEVLGDRHVHLFFGVERLVKLGYAWLFPKRDVVSVGWGNALSEVTSPRREYERFRSLPLVKEATGDGEVERRAAHLIPVAFREEVARGCVLGAGDAIGAVDPVSGKGIPYAMLSGRAAAKAISRALNRETGAKGLAERYARSLDAEFGAQLRKKVALRDWAFSSDANLKKFLALWERHRSSEIVAKGLHVSP